MTRSVRYHPEAADEVQGAVDWYRKRSAEAAAGFIAELDYAIEQVTALPETWPEYTANTRRYVFRVYPYSLIYRPWETTSSSLPSLTRSASPDTGALGRSSLRTRAL